MGVSETATHVNGPTETTTKKVSLIAIVLTVLAFFAPVASSGYAFGYSYFVNISAILWSVYIDEYGIRFLSLNPFSLIMMVPFLLFRVASVYQIIRYYQGKTTKGRAKIGAFIADAPFLIVYLFYFITFGIIGGIGLNLPLPIMMLVALFLIWKYPAYEPGVPWEGPDEFTPWWKEEPEEKTEPISEDQPW